MTQMFLKPAELIQGQHYVDTTGDRCMAVRVRELSTQSEDECEMHVVFLNSGRCVPLHLLGSLKFVPVAAPEAARSEPRREGRTAGSGTGAWSGRG